jgi:hypothetical protein
MRKEVVAVAFPSRTSAVRMDSRRRRFITITVFTLVALFLYTYAGHPSAVSSAVQAGLDYLIQLPPLPAANATLGVRLFSLLLLLSPPQAAL